MHSARLDRALRLADLAIGAGAVPLPVDPTPPVMRDAVAAADTPDDRQAVTPADHVIHAQPDDPARADPTAGDRAVPDDAVLKSLQASVDAIHASLHDDTTGLHQVLPGSLDDQSDLVSIAHAPATDLLDRTSDVDHSDVGLAATGTAGPGETLGQPPALETGELHGLQPVEATVATLTAPIMSTVDALLNVVHADAGAVTIPSLGGSGFDAMAGLLHPAAAPDPAHADPALTPTHDMPVFAAIGAPEMLHAVDQDLAHAVHAPAHLVGSGLI
jgi:hypothetical protein